MHYVFSNKYKITNSQKPEFRKNCFLHNLGHLIMWPKSINKYLENYFGFGSEEDKYLGICFYKYYFNLTLFFYSEIGIFRKISNANRFSIVKEIYRRNEIKKKKKKNSEFKNF